MCEAMGVGGGTAGGIVSRNLRAWKRKQLLARRTKRLALELHATLLT